MHFTAEILVLSLIFFPAPSSCTLPDARLAGQPSFNGLNKISANQSPYKSSNIFSSGSSSSNSSTSMLFKDSYELSVEADLINILTEETPKFTEQNASDLPMEPMELFMGVPITLNILVIEPLNFNFTLRNTPASATGFQLCFESFFPLLACLTTDDQPANSTSCSGISFEEGPVVIYKDDPLFNNETTYNIQMSPKLNSTYLYLTVMWTQVLNFVIIDSSLLNQQVQGNMTMGQLYYLQFQVYPENDIENLITLASLSINEVNMHLFSSIQDITADLTKSISSMNSSSNNNSYFYLGPDEYQSYCLSPASNHTYQSPCCLYGVASVPNTSMVTIVNGYQLSLRKDISSVQILEDTLNSVSAPIKINYSTKLYFYPNLIADIYVSYMSLTCNATIFINVINTTLDPSIDTWTFPTTDSAQFTSGLEGQAQIIIPEASLRSCAGPSGQINCALALTFLIDISMGTWQVIDIIINQRMSPIALGQLFGSQIEGNSVLYFSFYIEDPQNNILISAIVNEYVSVYISQGEGQRPTPWFSQFALDAISGNMQISPSQTQNNSMQGYWMIAVSACTAGNFSLIVNYEGFVVQAVIEGYPTEVTIENPETVYFNYQQFTFCTEVNIKFIVESGTGVFFISTLNNTSNIAYNLPSYENSTWNGTLESAQERLTINSSDPNYCGDCYYIIGVRADQKLQLTLVVVNQYRNIILVQNSFAVRGYVDAQTEDLYIPESFRLASDLNILMYNGSANFQIAFYTATGEKIQQINYLLDDSNRYFKVSFAEVLNDYNITSATNSFIISVTSLQSSSYALLLSKYNASTPINGGFNVSGFLTPNESDTYLFFVDPEIPSSQVGISTYRDIFTPFLNDTTLTPTLNLFSTHDPLAPDNLTRQNFQIASILTSEDSLLIHRQVITFNPNSSNSVITISNNGSAQQHLNFSINLDPMTPLSLPLDVYFTSKVAANISDFFMVEISEAGTLTIEIRTCIGFVNVTTSQTLYGSSASNVYKESVNTSMFVNEFSIEFIMLNITEPTPVYIEVAAINGANIGDVYGDEEAVYKIVARFYTTDQLNLFLPPTNFQAGDNGDLKSILSRDGNLEVSFQDVVDYQNTIPGLSISHSFDLFISNDQTIGQFISTCDILPSASGEFINTDMTYTSRNFESGNYILTPQYCGLELALPDTNSSQQFATLRVMVNGTDAQGNLLWSYPILYQTVMIEASGSWRIAILLWMVLVIVVIFSLTVCFYRIRRLKITNKEKYKLMDSVLKIGV